MKTTSIILLLAAMFLGLGRLTSIQQARQADQPSPVTLDLTALAR